MKIYYCLLSLLISLLGCASHPQKSNSLAQIEFTSLTRGYSMHIAIGKDSIIETTTDRGTEHTVKKRLDGKDWSLLVKSLNDVSLTGIPDLKSPTMKRAYDGARHSTITITTTDQVTVTHAFDDEQPHAKLHKLMSQINKIKVKYLEENN